MHVQDSGRYTCEATNIAGKTEKNYNLNVWGKLILCHCRAFGLTWRDFSVFLGLLDKTETKSFLLVDFDLSLQPIITMIYASLIY